MDEYSEICVRFGGGIDFLDEWLAIRDVIDRRSIDGWHFEELDGPDDRTLRWRLGQLGEARLSVTPRRLHHPDDGPGVSVWDPAKSDEDPYYDADHLPSPAAFERWLDAHEHEYDGFSPTAAQNVADELEASMRRWTDGT